MSDAAVIGVMALATVFAGIHLARHAAVSRRRLRDVFPSERPDTVVYRMAKAHACSEGAARFARLSVGGDVEVIVSRTELWVRPAAAVRWFTSGAEHDLLHRVPLDRVHSAEVTRWQLGPAVVLTFDGADGRARRLKVQVRDPDTFISALGVLHRV